MSLEKSLKESDLILNAQRQLLIEAAPKTLVVSVVAAVICYFLLRSEVNGQFLSLWLLVNIAITIVRAALLWHIVRNKNNSAARLARQVNLLTITIGLSGLSWGFLVMLWHPSMAVVTQLQLLLFPVVLAAGAVSGYGMWLRAYVVFMLACITPMTLGFLFIDNGSYTATAAPALLYMAALFVLSKSYQRSVIESIRLRFENNSLIEDLSSRNLQLVAARDDAEAASRSKSEFLACMSHEIRTPMNGVLGVTELLMATDLSPRQQKLTSTILQSGHSLLTIINDILSFSKNESADIDYEITAFNLKECIEQLEDLLKPKAIENKNDLIIKYGDDIPDIVVTDATRLQQALMNLIGNAIKFTEHGKITLRIERTGEKTEQHAILKFSVTDTGIGIANNKLEKIFEPFSQADGSTTRQYGGTGLGLSIVRQILDGLNGTISVTSQPGEGSCFIIQLPVQERSNAVTEIPEKITTPNSENIPSGTDDSLEGLQILVAEDCEINQMVIEAMLEQLGCIPLVVENGQLAVEAANSSKFEIILMDCQMPVMDGYTATQLIRKAEKHPTARTPILAVTANCLPTDKQRCYDCGMDDFMSKPF